MPEIDHRDNVSHASHIPVPALGEAASTEMRLLISGEIPIRGITRLLLEQFHEGMETVLTESLLFQFVWAVTISCPRSCGIRINSGPIAGGVAQDIAPFFRLFAGSSFYPSRVGTFCRVRTGAVGPFCFAGPQSGLRSFVAIARPDYREVRDSPQTGICSTGWCVVPSWPRPILSWVNT